MRKFIASCLIGGALVLGSVGGAFAAPPAPMPGTPGEANCKGQTTAYLAQLAKNNEFFPDEFRGLGGVSRASGLSVQQLQDLAAYCAGELNWYARRGRGARLPPHKDQPRSCSASVLLAEQSCLAGAMGSGPEYARGSHKTHPLGASRARNKPNRTGGPALVRPSLCLRRGYLSGEATSQALNVVAHPRSTVQ